MTETEKNRSWVPPEASDDELRPRCGGLAHRSMRRRTDVDGAHRRLRSGADLSPGSGGAYAE